MSQSKHRAEQYAEAVSSGEIVACRYVKQAVARYYRDLEDYLDKGWHFDRQAAERAIAFMEKLKHTKGELAGQRLILEPWQCFIMWNIFGWLNADGTRRFRYAYIDVGRKNGKTTWSAGVGLAMLYADGEARAEVYSAATTKDQAKLAFEDAKAMVKKSDLSDRLRTLRNAVVDEERGGLFKALSADSEIQDGLSPSCCIIDEFHAHKDSGMFDVLKSAMGARRQPLMFIITTAGFNKSGICYAYRNNVIKVLANVNQDDTLFAIIYTLDDKEEWDKPNSWIKANPNLGISCKFDYMVDQIQDAKNRPEAVRNVMTKNVNLWVDAETTWILDDKWMASRPERAITLEDLRGRECYGGMDLSNISDLTALALIFEIDGFFYLLVWCWIPEVKMREKISKENINYDAWVRDGYVVVTDGDAIDYDYIEHDIAKLHEIYNIRSIAYDRYNSSQVVINLQKEGFEMTPFGQGFVSMSAPAKQLQTLVLTNKLEHFDNPVLRWAVASTAVSMDPAGNIKPDKRKSSQKIDPVVASVMALGEWMTEQAKEDNDPYARRGLLK